MKFMISNQSYVYIRIPDDYQCNVPKITTNVSDADKSSKSVLGLCRLINYQTNKTRSRSCQRIDAFWLNSQIPKTEGHFRSKFHNHHLKSLGYKICKSRTLIAILSDAILDKRWPSISINRLCNSDSVCATNNWSK